MHLDDLASEIILSIFQNCTSLIDVLNLARSCRRMNNLFSASRKVQILYHVAECEFGPLHDINQLVTLNNTQPAHFVRDPPRSDALLRQVVMVGRVAKRWEEIYPFFKWDLDFDHRRSLSTNERFRLRRAVYRYWLYTSAFHNPAFPRTWRRLPHIVLQRTRLLHNWPTDELIEIEDLQATIRRMISTKICPSDSMVRAMDCCDSVSVLFPAIKPRLTSALQDFFHTSVSRDGYATNLQYCLPEDRPCGWGDPVAHYYVVEDMMKLDPRAVLHLYDHPQKRQVESYLDSLGEWFCNNGDTFSETLAYVMEGRELERAEADQEGCFGIVDHFTCSDALS